MSPKINAVLWVIRAAVFMWVFIKYRRNRKRVEAIRKHVSTIEAHGCQHDPCARAFIDAVKEALA